MSYDEYWNQDPWLAKDYRDAWELKQKNDNYLAWLNGLYNYKAFGVIIGNAFRKKGHKADNYFEKPIDMDGEKEKTPQQIRQEVYNRLSAFKEKWDGNRRRSKNTH